MFCGSSSTLRVLLATVLLVAKVDCDSSALCLLQTGASVNVERKRMKNVVSSLQSQAPTLPPEVGTGAPTNAAEATGVAGNAAADGAAFISGLIANSVMIVVCFAIFMHLRPKYPLTYCNNVLIGAAPTKALGSNPEEVQETLNSRWGWWTASMNTDIDEIADTMGLDQAMLLAFAELGMRILKLVGIPMICIVGPINCAFGGQPAWAIGDYLSSLSFGNVENGSPLYWMHSLVVWYVVIVVQVSVYAAQKRFLDLRFQWLRNMAEGRSNTLLIEGIPDEHRSDAKMKDFFGSIFGKNAVKSAYVVKDTKELCALVTRHEAATKGLAEAKAKWANDEEAPEKRPRSYLYGDLIDYYTKELEESEPLIKEERARIQKEMTEVGGVNTYCGFVTFTERKSTQMATTQLYSEDRDDWVVSLPPEPVDLIWSDLQQDPTRRQGREALGMMAVVGLYFAYMPIVLGVSKLATLIDAGPLESLWIALAPTMGLQFMVAFLPTFLILIFNVFYTLKAEVWAQKRLQTFYFWFQVVFVVLVTAIGNSVVEFTKTVFTDPLELPRLLGDTMPLATHFYMNFLVLQWVTHAMNIIRYVPLSKFLAATVLFEEEEARMLSEPEDQDYYGIGSRSARFSINLMIGIVYGTLSPPINFLAWVNFYLCRLIYGYLMPFAETKKADLGGAFWVEQLNHIFVANIIYVIVMTGVLSGRANMTGFTPTYIAAPSLIYVLWSYNRFQKAFSWETLPISKVANDQGVAQKGTKRTLRGDYVQPELFPQKK
eukprot:TRINITY_DN299_c1_g1_i5.p1 TRINITY_DN299_c1_g1~~TRINITY_DN299_c1_g1_i5.p1  ORF type:complete len:771 (-),score=164.49 TRINITY_DN299_c1_g1_i5:68-2380(-)